MRLRLLGLAAIAAALVASIPTNLRAQTTNSGGLAGNVTDPSNKVVPEAVLELKDQAKGTILVTKTDADGGYLFSFVLPGKYVLKVADQGFETTEIPVNVFLGPPGALNVKLKIATASTTVTV